MSIQLFRRLLERSKKAVYRGFKILLIASTISLPIQQTANSDDDILGVNFNDGLGQNQLWSLNSTTDTKTLLQTFEFQSGYWSPSKSYVDERTGKFWMWDSNDTFTVYDVENDTITRE